MIEVYQKRISKKECVACQNKFFAGHVLEVLDHLCKKHKEEYSKERVKEIKDYLEAVKN